MIKLLGTYTEDNASKARDDAQRCNVTCLKDPNTFLLFDEIDVPLLDFGGVGKIIKGYSNVSGVTATAVSEESKSENLYMEKLGFTVHNMYKDFKYDAWKSVNNIDEALKDQDL